MSEIEFRAWHKPTKTMHRVLVIDWLNQMVDLDGGLIEQSFDDVVIEQCSGVDDIVGELIYEGDVLKATSRYEDIETEIESVESCISHLKLSKQSYDAELYDYEVIGNIHEKPELLEDKLL